MTNTDKSSVRNRSALRLCAGVSMLEMLVAMTLAIVLMLSLVLLYFGAAKTAAREENISSASRDGRLITRRLARDFRLVGLIAHEDLDGDSNDINRDVPGQFWSDSTRDDFEHASTRALVFMGDVDNDDRTETVHLFHNGDSLLQRTWKWSTSTRSWEGPIRRILGTNIDLVVFDYYDRDGVRIPDTTGFPVGGFVLSEGQRRRITSVEVTLVMRSDMPENRPPERLEVAGTTFNDTYRRTLVQFRVRGRNLSLGN